MFVEGQIRMNHIHQDIHGWCNFYDVYDDIIRQLPQNFAFAEVGVWKGHSISYFTVEAINRGKTGRIYAVDTFEGSSEHRDPNSIWYEPLLEHENGLYYHFIDNIAPIKEYITPVVGDSVSVARMFDDASLDAIFIDAGHDYDSVTKDLIAWYPKVKPGGIFCGHDYEDNWIGVKNAVDDFAKCNMLSVAPIGLTSWVIFEVSHNFLCAKNMYWKPKFSVFG